MQNLVNGKQYEGKYVALDSKGKIIASGLDIGIVIETARRLGHEIPSVVFVPDPNITYIY